MINKQLESVITKARDLARDKKINVSIHYHHENSHLMRIGNNSVSLNTSEELTRFDIEVVDGKRSGTHTHLGDIQTAEELFEIILKVVDKASKSSEMDFLPVLPVIEGNLNKESQYDATLDHLDPAKKEAVYSAIFKSVGEDYNYSGSWSSGSTEVFSVSTANDYAIWNRLTDQQFTCVLKHPEKMWELASWQTGWQTDEVNAENSIRDFKNLLPIYENNEGYRVEPGKYKVILGSQSIGDLMPMMVGTGCGGRINEMKMSWTTDKKIGDQILNSKVTITDDPENSQTFSDPISDSGQFTKKCKLVDDGKLAGYIYDRNTASKYSKEATPNAGCFVMEAGKANPDFLEAVKDYDKVLYIPAIHYMNMPNMSKGIFTGSSRFSAVLIEKGKIVSPIFSSRITDQFENVFGNILKISSETVSVNGSHTYGRRAPSAVSVPSWMLVDDVKITDCADSF